MRGRPPSIEHYVEESDRVLLDDTVSMVRARGGSVTDLPSFEPAGPPRTIFFDPSKTRAGIVTCGGCARVSMMSSAAWSAT